MTKLNNLITRIFDTKEGEILLDNINIKDLTEDELRKNISIIRQEPFIFNKTIKENFELIGQWLQGTEKYFLQNFLDSGDLIGKKTRGCSGEEMKEFLATVQKYIPSAKLRGM